MAAVASRDEEAFTEHWRKILADPHSLIRTVLYDGEVVVGGGWIDSGN
jgi:hypothetical protein